MNSWTIRDYKVSRVVKKIFSLMETEGLNISEAEHLIKMLPELFQRNNELVAQTKPFKAWKDPVDCDFRNALKEGGSTPETPSDTP